MASQQILISRVGVCPTRRSQLTQRLLIQVGFSLLTVFAPLAAFSQNADALSRSALQNYAKERVQNRNVPAADVQKKWIEPASAQIKSLHQQNQISEAELRNRAASTGTPLKKLTPEQIKKRELEKARRKAYLDAKKGSPKDRARKMAEFKKNWGTRQDPKYPGGKALVKSSSSTSSPSNKSSQSSTSRPEVRLDGKGISREVEFGNKPQKKDFSDLPSAPPAELMGP